MLHLWPILSEIFTLFAFSSRTSWVLFILILKGKEKYIAKVTLEKGIL